MRQAGRMRRTALACAGLSLMVATLVGVSAIVATTVLEEVTLPELLPVQEALVEEPIPALGSGPGHEADHRDGEDRRGPVPGQAHGIHEHQMGEAMAVVNRVTGSDRTAQQVSCQHWR